MELFSLSDFKIKEPAKLGVGCNKCRLDKHCKTPKMPPVGKCLKRFMIISESVSPTEDSTGEPLSGEGAKYVRRLLSKYGFKREDDYLYTHAIACRESARGISADQVNYCRGRLWGEIRQYQPMVILALGEYALASLIDYRWNTDSIGAISRWRGYSIPDRDTNSWIVPTLNPHSIIKSSNSEVVSNIFDQDFGLAVSLLKKKLPVYKEENSCVRVCETDVEAMSYLCKIKQGDIITIDYETTGLKPYREEQKIVCIGIGLNKDKAICFPTTFEHSVYKYRMICADSQIGKIAHNIMFEDLWTREKLKVQIEGWDLCTMQAAHILDPRPGVAGLKFQSYVNLGVIDYSSSISPHLEVTSKELELYGDNGLNGLVDCTEHMLKDVMKYCAIDCLNTYRLALVQKEKLGI